MSMFRRRLLMYQALMNKSGNIVYPGLIAAWSAKGKTNDDEDRATLKDLTGNGHDIILNGFAFSEMSGYNGYDTNFNNWKTFSNNETYYQTEIISNSKIKFRIGGGRGYALLNNFNSANTYSIIHFKIEGLEKNNANFNFGRGNTFFYSDNIKKDGLYEVDINKFLLDNNISRGEAGFKTFDNENPNNIKDADITIELIPNYPDALVFDGVDDYGINEDMPILMDYTIIAKRERDISKPGPLLIKSPSSGNGEFIFEGGLYYKNNVSFGYLNNPEYQQDSISYSTPINYNGQTMQQGDTSVDKTPQIWIGALRNNLNYIWKGAFYSAYLFDRSLDEQEIKAFIRKYIDPEYLLPSEIPTPDCYYDLSQGSNDDETRETIKDYSGNGNDAVAHNFAWSGMSGYGGYIWNFKNFSDGGNQTNTVLELINDHTIKVTKSILIAPNPAIYLTNFTGTNFIVRVSNKPDNIKAEFGNTSKGRQEIFNGDNIINLSFSNEAVAFYFDPFDEGNITIELLPKYPGALVFDGVDDYVSLDAFDSGFKTMFMVCNIFKLEAILYDQRSTGNDYAIFNTLNSVAYNARNGNPTYINGIQNNNILTNELLNKKHLISVYTQNVNTASVTLGTNKSKSIFSNMALYKFLGFKETLTEEQIQAVIKKYNLLDGVDEIEVS